ncbi:MAG: 2-phospho-L-lactate guanylyltransferase [Candidatus Binataceae bacterium]|nr:2-phospho-L-lactate guanylyltransferase [Candidatus Binataceae bacterium]
MRVALIAAKQLEFAKTRLGPAMPAAERQLLAEAMFRDVLAAAIAARTPDQVALVSSDERLLAIARGAGAITIDEQFPRGLNAAVRLGTELLIAQGAEAVCVALSDIPLIRGSDIDTVFAALSNEKGVAMVPSRELSGTNMIARMPPDAIPTRFGRQSLMRHLESCEQAGLRCQLVRLAGPAMDLDLMSDLADFVRIPSSTHTFNHLSRLGLTPA